MKVNAPSKTNPQPNPQNKSGMENFLSPSSQTIQEVEVPKQKQTVAPKAPKNQIEELLEEMIKKIQKEVVKEIEFSKFSEIIYKKNLMFKLLFAASKIYVLVRDPNASDKSAIVAVAPPRWGGSSLRFLISMCAEDWCVVKEKNTQRGKILTYQVVGETPEADDIDDIFD